MLRKQLSNTHDKLNEMIKTFYELFYNDETGEFENPYTFRVREKLSLRHQMWNLTLTDMLHPINDRIKILKDIEDKKTKEQ